MESHSYAPGRSHRRRGSNSNPQKSSNIMYYLNFSPIVFVSTLQSLHSLLLLLSCNLTPLSTPIQILSLKFFAFHTLLSLFVYLWKERSSPIQALFELFMGCFLTGMSIWSLMKAVFTDPGRPSRGGEEDLGEWEEMVR